MHVDVGWRTTLQNEVVNLDWVLRSIPARTHLAGPDFHLNRCSTLCDLLLFRNDCAPRSYQESGEACESNSVPVNTFRFPCQSGCWFCSCGGVRPTFQFRKSTG